MTDRRILYVAAFLRALATGMLGVLIGIYLATLGLPAGRIGVIVGLGLAGGAAATAAAMFLGDRVGRKRFLIALALLGILGTIGFLALADPWAIAAAAFIGMLNGMGRDRGAALALEQAVLPATANDRERTRVMAWYNVLQDAGHALGSLCAGIPVLLRAAWLAGRIGLVRTMVFTHIPSSLLLVTVPFAPNFAIAAVLFLLREGLVEMDVPTRQSYVLAVVKPEERTVASTVTALVRLGAWAIAPSFAGLFMQGSSIAAPLWIGAGMKITYDLLLWRAFRSRHAPEEIAERA